MDLWFLLHHVQVHHATRVYVCVCVTDVHTCLASYASYITRYLFLADY